MRFTKFSVTNFRSFRDGPTFDLAPGLNVLVGQNNAGKTALLDALNLKFVHEPHRSIRTVPTASVQISGESRADFSFEIESAELFTLLGESVRTFYVPYVQNVPHPGSSPDVQGAAAAAWLPKLRTVGARYLPGVPIVSVAVIDAPWGGGSDERALRFEAEIDKPPHYVPGVHNVDKRSQLPYTLVGLFTQRIYLFRADRRPAGECAVGVSDVLAADAANLPEVLHSLHSRFSAGRFVTYLEYVRAVFPTIKHITIPNVGSSLRILLWGVDPRDDREDLAIPLSVSGTGIGQILALLYVVVTAQYPHVILIDEPNSFLHPGALRKLMEILLSHPQHQYIVSTHSPLVFNSPSVTTLLHVQLVDAESVVQAINLKEPNELKSVLADVGARLSDVYGADSILWVEGPTEEECFPIIRQLARKPGDPVTGSVILGVKQTGDFERPDARRIVEIYQRLAKAPALLPPAIAFLFDREGRSPQEREDLNRRTQSKVRFIPRRMFENYLLVPEAIAAVANDIPGFRSTRVTAKEIGEWIESRRWDAAYISATDSQDRSNENWEVASDGAKMLVHIFRDLSENAVRYDKVRDGLSLTNWIVANKPEILVPLAQLIENLLQGAKAS